MNRTDLQQLAEIRLDEATALLRFATPLPDGAYYLAGYAVECALKACIAKLNHQHDWPDKKFVSDCHTHDLSALVRLAGLNGAHVAETTANTVFARNWIIVKDWNETSRYERHSQAEAQAMVHAVKGVLPWIKARW